MLKSISVRVPICIIGQSLVQYNYPVLCYLSDENRISLILSRGVGGIKVEWQSPLARYLEKMLCSTLSTYLDAMNLDVYVRCDRSLPPIDALTAILYAILNEVRHEELSTHLLLRKLRVPDERARAVFEIMNVKGLVAYRGGEGSVELREDLPWSIGLCLKVPFRFRLSEFKDFEESFNAIVHALGRLIIVVARSIIDGDFEAFRRALTKYSRLSLAISNLPLTVLRAYERLSKINGVACKIDEDFRGFMLFSEEEDLLYESLNMASRMGFQIAFVRG